MKRPLSFADGIGTGIAVLAIAAACWIATRAADFMHMYRDMGSQKLPPLTRIVLTQPWIYAAPIALVAGLIGMYLWRPRGGMILLAVAAIVVDAIWYLGAYAPIWQLAGNIQG